MNKKWQPPKCFLCKNFTGVTGMDMMCKKNKDACLGIVSRVTLVQCKKEGWFKEGMGVK